MKEHILLEIWPDAGRIVRIFLFILVVCLFLWFGIETLEPGDYINGRKVTSGGAIFYRALWGGGLLMACPFLYALYRNWSQQLCVQITEHGIRYQSSKKECFLHYEDISEIKLWARKRGLGKGGKYVTDIRCYDKEGKRLSSPKNATLGSNQDRDELMDALELAKKKYPGIEVTEAFLWV